MILKVKFAEHSMRKKKYFVGFKNSEEMIRNIYSPDLLLSSLFFFVFRLSAILPFLFFGSLTGFTRFIDTTVLFLKFWWKTRRKSFIAIAVGVFRVFRFFLFPLEPGVLVKELSIIITSALLSMQLLFSVSAVFSFFYVDFGFCVVRLIGVQGSCWFLDCPAVALL